MIIGSCFETPDLVHTPIGSFQVSPRFSSIQSECPSRISDLARESVLTGLLKSSPELESLPSLLLTKIFSPLLVSCVKVLHWLGLVTTVRNRLASNSSTALPIALNRARERRDTVVLDPGCIDIS